MRAPHGSAFATGKGEDGPPREAALSWMVTHQLGRRHLTPSQKAVIALEVEKHFAREAKKRRGARTDLVQKIAPSDFGKARDHAARALKVNRQYVQDAKTLAVAAPDLKWRTSSRSCKGMRSRSWSPTSVRTD